MNKLMEIELEEIQDISQEKERFKIENLESANWALRKLKAIEDKGKEITALVNKEIERILEWKDSEIKQLGDSKDFFDFLLTEYYTEQKALDPKFKLSTPYGKVSSRKQQAKWNYEDDVIIEDLEDKEYDFFIRIKKEVDKTEFKKLVHVLNDVVSLNGELEEDIAYNKDIKMFVNKETGEIEDKEIYEYHEQVVVYNSKIIEGITVEERPDTITIKVIE